ncbi:MAG: superoxide dismutase [Desulfobacterales bacterium SG8_35_2]|jgi:nickel superoxide dismutase|nr:MAG: superoxide dismutase [Desulfobacterales bacterium SG8_35_2]
MKKRLLQAAMVLFCTLLLAGAAAAHCEIPCGIYDDEARVAMLLEHVATIEKSMNQIITIEKEKEHNANQLVRWVMNKEKHADELQEIVSQYFMTQRIKLDTKEYDKKLALLHQMLVYAMKCKQTTDLAHTAKLTAVIKEFKELYFAK